MIRVIVTFFLLTLSSSENLYPQVSFARTLYPDDIYGSYCLGSGETSTQQGSPPLQEYFAVQSCSSEHGILVPSDSSLQIGFHAAVVDLGTLETIRARYGLNQMDPGSVFTSIHYDSSLKTIVIADSSTTQQDPMTFQPLLPQDVGPLNATRDYASVNPVLGHYYLARVTTKDQSSLSTETGMLLKFYFTSATPPYHLRWSIFYADWPVGAPTTDASSSDSSDSDSKAALGLAIVSFIMILGVIAYLFSRQCRKQDEGYVQDSS